jgi:hypothetical protein
MRPLIFLFALVGVGLGACDDRYPAPTAMQTLPPLPKSSHVPIQASPTPSTPTIPNDVSYSVETTAIRPGIKRSLDVHLNKKVSEEVLAAIATKLKAEDTRQYDRTFITYYISEVDKPKAMWATTHFNPTLKVEICGLSSEDAKSLLAVPMPPSREVIGRWLDETPYAPCLVTIYREDDKFYIEERSKNNSCFSRQLVERQTDTGRRFDKAEHSDAGDHWLIDAGGNLQARDNDGLITATKKPE